MENENINNEETEEKDVEVMEFSLMDEEIEELIDKLHLLKETKEPVQFEIDDGNELIINYEESDEEDEEEAPLGVPPNCGMRGQGGSMKNE